jgi:hypothetical protein
VKENIESYLLTSFTIPVQFRKIQLIYRSR